MFDKQMSDIILFAIATTITYFIYFITLVFISYTGELNDAEILTFAVLLGGIVFICLQKIATMPILQK